MEAWSPNHWTTKEFPWPHSFFFFLSRKLFFSSIYLFIIYLFLAESGLSCSMWDLSLRRAGFSLVLVSEQAPERAGSVVTVGGLSSCGVQAPEHTGFAVVACGLSSCCAVGSVVAACGPSCPVACGILIP